MNSKNTWKSPPILMYHSISQDDLNETGAELYSVSEGLFREHLDYLLMNNPKTLITFDDGREDNYRIAYPLLEAAGLKAFFFVLPTRIGRPGYMNWRQLRELKKGGMIIGSHGISHNILTTLSNDKIYYELRHSKELIEDKMGHVVNFLSIPRGFYDRRVTRAAIEAGYRAIFTSDPRDRSNFKYGRIAVKSDWDAGHLDMVLNNKPPAADVHKSIAIWASKKIFGPVVYDRLRTLVLNEVRR